MKKKYFLSIILGYAWSFQIISMNQGLFLNWTVQYIRMQKYMWKDSKIQRYIYTLLIKVKFEIAQYNVSYLVIVYRYHL